MYKDIVEYIKYNRDALDLITDLVPIPLFVKDRAGRYIACNNAFCAFLSFRREEIIGKSVYDIWSKDEADIFFAQDNALFEQGSLQIYETKITSSDGKKHTVQFHKQVFKDSNGETSGFLGAIFDITEKKELEYALAQQATTDELTGLPNRREGMTRLAILHKDSQKNGRPYCIAMVDLDHFKQINDRFGHSNGDTVLHAFSELVRRSLRGSDICFRYGGEEFVILLPETRLDLGYTVAERLRQAWADTEVKSSDGQSIYSTVSVGIAQYSGNFSSCEHLLAASDKALYRAKNAGRNCSASFSPADMP